MVGVTPGGEVGEGVTSGGVVVGGGGVAVGVGGVAVGVGGVAVGVSGVAVGGGGVGVGETSHGGKLADFSGFRSARSLVSTSTRRELASGLTPALLSGPYERTTLSPGFRVTSTAAAAPVGRKKGLPPRAGGICRVSTSGTRSDTLSCVRFATVMVPLTLPSGAQVAVIDTISTGPKGCPAAGELLIRAAPMVAKLARLKNTVSRPKSTLSGKDPPREACCLGR